MWLEGEFDKDGKKVGFARVNALMLDGREERGKLEGLKGIKVRAFDGSGDWR